MCFLNSVTSPREADPHIGLQSRNNRRTAPLNDNNTEIQKDNFKRDPKCLPQKNVALLKMNKCSSSTVANILLRHVLTNSLNLVVDKDRQLTYVGNSAGV
jgi:hypothetical protein